MPPALNKLSAGGLLLLAVGNIPLAAAEFPSSLHGKWYIIGTNGLCDEYPELTVDAAGATYEAGYCRPLTVSPVTGTVNQWRIKLRCGAESMTRNSTAIWSVSSIGNRKILLQFEQERGRFYETLVECKDQRK